MIIKKETILRKKQLIQQLNEKNEVLKEYRQSVELKIKEFYNRKHLNSGKVK